MHVEIHGAEMNSTIPLLKIFASIYGAYSRYMSLKKIKES